jgi:hypothetical protein
VVGWPHIFGKKNDGMSDAEWGLTAGILQSENQRPTNDAEAQRELGINIQMVDSDDLMKDIERLAWRHYQVSDGNGGLREVVVPHPVFLALKIEINRLHCMRVLNPIDAEIAICQLRYNFNKQKMKLSYPEYQQFGGVIDALERMAIGAVHDSVKGSKSKLLKVTPRTFEVQFNRGGQKGEGNKGFMP